MVTFKIGRCLLHSQLQKRRMTQQELAERTGYSKQSISRYVKNMHVMSYETALNISKVLDCNMEDLYEIWE